MGTSSIPGRSPLPREVSEGRIVAIGRRLPAGSVLQVGGALQSAGVRAFELTLNAPEADALGAISALAHRYAEGMLIGAGTVMSIDAAQRAIDAGARFLVCPHTDLELVAWAVARGVPILPGALTPSEVVRAWDAGATAVKLFPASAVGPGFVRELRGPLPHIGLIPTGGVTVDDAGAYIRAGAVAVGLGSWLIGDGDEAGVRARARQVQEAIGSAVAAASTPLGSAG